MNRWGLMKEKIQYSYKENINKGKTIYCYCNNCTIVTKHIVIFDYKEDVDDFEEGLSVKDDYQIIKCENCNQLSFRIDGWFSENRDPFPGGMMEPMKNCTQRVIEINGQKRRFVIYHII